MIGKTISHYKILEKLGEGGMGVVYKAEDTKLKRFAALKFLPPDLTRDGEARERFIQEAQAASGLDHPNICTIYEIGESEDGPMFISMPCYEGETLKRKIERGPLGPEEAVSIVLRVAEGLTRAHEAGIVHRDIKPANIMVTDRGDVKLLDFGLAKLAAPTRLTRAGTMMGTVAYVSPEQAHGESVDHRTDIWSLGVVLYEMLTGELPFKGDYEPSVVYSILKEEPAPLTSLRPEVPVGLDRVVSKAMAKNPDERFGDARQLISVLGRCLQDADSMSLKEEIRAPKVSASVVVLPFVNMSADKEQEYFCDGMAEEIINVLAKLENLRVVARTSAFAFKGEKLDVREIGRKLGVESVLEGSVRTAGTRLRISAQLINVADGCHLWSERYDREMDDVFVIQDEISKAIVEALRIRLVDEEEALPTRGQADDVEVHNLCLKGRWFWNKRTEEGIRKALEYFREAIRKSPDYALAHAGMAGCYTALASYNLVPPTEAYPKAKEAALMALEIDGSLAEARSALAFIKMSYDWDLEGAEKEFQRAIDLSPGWADTHHLYALYLLYTARFEQSLEEIKRALELDPLSLVINRNLGSILIWVGRHDEAIEQLEAVAELDPNFTLTHFFLGLAYLKVSRYEEALAEFRKEMALSEGLHPEILAWTGVAFSGMGNRDKVQKVVDSLVERSKHEYVPAFSMATSYFALGEDEQGFEWLERAYAERDLPLGVLQALQLFDSVRNDERFSELLERIGLRK
jgi:TolB-like protein/Tfp pilus assembly protein PilF/tRNA A-37 threonylcarbamoyl transferase component Bud32